MGRQALRDMIEQLPDRRAVLHWHLTANHYPPYPVWMVDVAEAAIDTCKEGDSSKRITLSDGVVHNVHGAEVLAWVLRADDAPR